MKSTGRLPLERSAILSFTQKLLSSNAYLNTHLFAGLGGKMPRRLPCSCSVGTVPGKVRELSGLRTYIESSILDMGAFAVLQWAIRDTTNRHFCHQIRSGCVDTGGGHTWGSRGGSDALCRGGAAVQAPRPVTVCHQEPAPQGVPLGTHCRETAALKASSQAVQSLPSEEKVLVAKLIACAHKGADIAKRQQYLESCYTKQCRAHLHGRHSCHRAYCNSLMSPDVALQVQQKVTTDIEGIETELVGSSACKICMLESAEKHLNNRSTSQPCTIPMPGGRSLCSIRDCCFAVLQCGSGAAPFIRAGSHAHMVRRFPWAVILQSS